MRNGDEAVLQQAMDDVSERGNAIYADRLRALVEPERQNAFIAIHVDSGDYAVARTTAAATRDLLKRHSADGRIYLRKIGDEPEYELAARALAGEMMAGRSK